MNPADAGMTIREAEVADAPAMGRFMVATWLAAHRSHLPSSVWRSRRREWTPEVSAHGWARVLRERDASPGRIRACFLIAEDEHGTMIGLAARAASAPIRPAASAKSARCTSIMITGTVDWGGEQQAWPRARAGTAHHY